MAQTTDKTTSIPANGEFEVGQERDPWGRAPYWLMSRVQPSAFVVYVALTRFAWMKDGCRPSLERIAKETGLGRTTVKRGVDELEKVGAVTIEHRFADGESGGGRLPSRYYLRTSDPEGVPSAEQGGVPLVDPPWVQFGPTPGSKLDHEVEVLSKKEQTHTSAEADECHEADSSASSSASVDPFDEFWSVYPRTKDVSKKIARQKFRLAARGTPAASIVDAARRYAEICGAKGTAQEHICHPSTWLHQERYAADYLQPDYAPAAQGLGWW